jgi:hypothetical protein
MTKEEKELRKIEEADAKRFRKNITKKEKK